MPRALGPADYGAFAVALALATGIATATGIGGPALFARVLAPLDGARRRDVARTLALRIGRTRAALLGGLAAAALAAAMLAPGEPGAADAALRRAALWCACVVAPACALGALAAEPLLEATLGEHFGGAAGALRIALAAAALAPLWALGNQLAWVVFLSVPGSGAQGAAAVMLAGVGAATAATFAALRRRA